MVNSWLAKLFSLRNYTDPVQRQRAVGTYAVSVITFIAAIVLLVLIPLDWNVLTAAQQLTYWGTCLLLLLTAGITIALTTAGRQRDAALIATALIFLTSIGVTFTSAIDARGFLVIAMAAITLAGYLLGSRAALVLLVPTWLLFLVAWMQTPGLTASSWYSFWGIYTPSLLAHAMLSYLIARSLPGVAADVNRQASDRRVMLSEASNAVSQKLLSARLDLEDLLHAIVGAVKDIFADVSDVQVFLTDKDRSTATLVATTKTPAPQTPISVGIGSLSPVGRATFGTEPILARDTDPSLMTDRAYLRSEFLPGSRAQLTIPLRIGQDVIGALDIHSANPDAFLPEDIDALETLANQISVAIDNARLFAEAQAQSADNRRLYEQTRNSLREIERLNKQLIGTAWAEYLTDNPTIPAYTVDFGAGTTTLDAEWTPTMEAVVARNQPAVNVVDGHKVVGFPITVHGQVIGAMEFDVEADRSITQEQFIVLQQAVDRLGLTAENMRLFDNSQRTAQREAIVNEISGRMQAMTSVDAVIASVTQSLGDAIRASRVSVRIGSPDENAD